MTKIIKKAYKFRLKPTAKQRQAFNLFAGHCRFLWNKLLRLNLDRLYRKEKLIWRFEMQFWNVFWKNTEELSFLKQAPSGCQNYTIKALDRAFKDAFDKKQPLKRMPRIKKRHHIKSFQYPGGFKMDADNSCIFMPKIGWVKFIQHRPVEGNIKNVTVSRHGNYWYASIQVEQEIEEELHPNRDLIGIDMGIARFATLSDGSFIEPINSFKKLEKKLAGQQRALAKKIKSSSNWKKQQQKIAKTHIEIARVREHFLHNASRAIVNQNEIICVEDLKVSNMSKSAKGTLDEPGKNVKQKSGLNKSILDQGWAMFVQMLDYKSAWANGQLIKVPPHQTSQTCPECGYTDKDNRKSQAEFVCLQCSFKDNADLVAAKNILARGHKKLATG